MNNQTERKFAGRALLIALLLCTLPRLLRVGLNFFHAYTVVGNVAYSETASTLISAAADFLGTVSLFSGIAIVIYLAFLAGVRKGGEWIFALLGGYGAAILLVSAGGSATLGVILFALLVALTFAAVLIWLKGLRGVAAAVGGTYFLTVLGGMIILLGTGYPTVHEILSEGMLGLLFYGQDLLLLALSLGVVSILRRRALKKGGGSADIALESRLLPRGNPVLTAFWIVDVLYILIPLFNACRAYFSWVEDYGAPVNGEEWFALIFRPLLECAAFFLVGYFTMLFTAGRLEKGLRSSKE